MTISRMWRRKASLRTGLLGTAKWRGGWWLGCDPCCSISWVPGSWAIFHGSTAQLHSVNSVTSEEVCNWITNMVTVWIVGLWYPIMKCQWLVNCASSFKIKFYLDPCSRFKMWFQLLLLVNRSILVQFWNIYIDSRSAKSKSNPKRIPSGNWT